MECGSKSSMYWPWNRRNGVKPRWAAPKGPNQSWRSQHPKARLWPDSCRCPSLTPSNRRVRDPYARWCGRGGTARCPPIPIFDPWLSFVNAPPHGRVGGNEDIRIRLLLMLSGYSSADDIPCINPLRSQQAYFVMGVNLAVEPSKIPTQGCIIR